MKLSARLPQTQSLELKRAETLYSMPCRKHMLHYCHKLHYYDLSKWVPGFLNWVPGFPNGVPGFLNVVHGFLDVVP